MSLQNLAHHIQSAGRGDDSVLVHMTPHEVAGLQSLAAAHGGSMTVNPETGLPEAGFLSSILPTVIGAALAPATGGLSIAGMSAAASTGLLVGGAYGLATGSLKKGLMAGLGAYGGANLGAGLMEAGAATAAAPITAPSVVPPTPAVPTPAPAALGSGMVNTAPDILKSPLTGQPVGQAGMLGAPTQVTPPATGGTWPPAPAAAPASIVATGGATGAPSALAQMGGGVQNLLKDPEKLKAFLGDQKFNLLSSLASASTEYGDEEERKTPSGIPLNVYQYTPRYAPSPRIAGSTAERTYFAADGGLASLGPVEQMSQQNAMMDNTRYPMAMQNTPTYASPAERPVSQNVLYPSTDADVTPYSGTLRMAEGGIASLAAGGQTESQKEIANRTKEYNQWITDRNKEKTAYEKEFATNRSAFVKDWDNRISAFNRETNTEKEARQKEINKIKDRKEKAQAQTELNAWKAARDAESTGLTKERTQATKDFDAQKTDWLKEYNTNKTNYTKEHNATLDYLRSYDANKYTGYEGGIKGADKTALNKAYDTEIGKQKGEMDKAKAALDVAKRTGIQSVISRAQEEYDRQAGDYNAVSEGKKAGLEEFMQATKRTGELGTRGQYTTKLGDVDALKKEIADIKANPAQTGGMGARSLSKEQEDRIKELQSKLTGMSAAEKVYNPRTGQYETQEGEKFQKLTKAPAFGTAKKIMEEDDVNRMFEYTAGRRPTEAEMAKYLGKSMSEAQLAQQVGATAELGAAAKFTDDDLNAQAQYYWGRPMTKGELAWYKDPANKIGNFNQLRNAMTTSAAFLENVNKINQAAFNKQQGITQIAAEGPASVDQISSLYQDIFGKPPTSTQLQTARSSGLTVSQLAAQLKSSAEYAQKATQPFVPEIKTTTAPAGVQSLVPQIQAAASIPQTQAPVAQAPVAQAPVAQAPVAQAPVAPARPVIPVSQEQIDAYRREYMSPVARRQPGAGGYAFTPPQQQASIEGALPYQDVINRLGIGGVYSQLAQKLPEMQPGLRFGLPTAYAPLNVSPAQGMAAGGDTGGEYHLGDYSDGGRLLKGPGDGVSDSIPASINGRRPARLADGEFVIPARIVSELGNGSTEAGARQLYAMMDRIQKRRSKSMGKNRVAVDSRASQVLPA